MIEIRRSALVKYSPAQMFDLVNEVEAYPKRFGWCAGAKILERSDNMMVARLDLKLAGLSYSFTTRNTFERPHRLTLNSVDGPFRSLRGDWDFSALGEEGTKISLALDFDYAGRFGSAAFKLGFQGLANRMVNDFCQEADRLYG